MKLSINIRIFITRHVLFIAALVLCWPSAFVEASSIVYFASDSSNNFVPESEDGTPNRPIGHHLGNTILLYGSDRYLTSATIKVATNALTLPQQSLTLRLLRNDGVADPGGSGLQQPAELIGSATVLEISFAELGGIIPDYVQFPKSPGSRFLHLHFGIPSRFRGESARWSNDQ